MNLLERKDDIVKLLESKTVLKENCWVFCGSNSNGHGQIRIDGRLYLVHRLSAHLFHELNLEDNSNVNHKLECKYASCWNPNHIYIGTQKQNIKDIIKNGKFTAPYKSAEIRALLKVCKHGHEFSGNNLIIIQGKRRCRACHNINEKIRLRKIKRRKNIKNA